MQDRFNFFSGQSDKPAYQPVAGGDVVVASVEQDNTELFNKIPDDVLALIAANLTNHDDLGRFALLTKKTYRTYEKYFDNTDKFNKLLIENLAHIASYLPKEDIINFFLTTKKTLHAFEDFKGNTKQDRLQVMMPTSRRSLYQGAPAEVNFRDVNHVLMAQHFLRIQMNDVEARKDELNAAEEKRKCIAFGISITLGVVLGLAAHAGGAILCDQVILPRCVTCCMNGTGHCDLVCTGQICNAVVPNIPGPYGHAVAMGYSLCEYRACNICCCYIPMPLVCSLPVGCGIGLAPALQCSSSEDQPFQPWLPCLRGPTYYALHDGIVRKIGHLNSANKQNFRDIIDLNTTLRERKLGGASYGMFKPAVLKMEDEKPQPQPNDNNAPQAPQRISME